MIRKKGKRPPKEKGLPRDHKQLGQRHARNLRTIKGIYLCWKKAPKYVLRLDADTANRMYVGKGNKLVHKLNEAMQFAVGFDREDIKLSYWQKTLRVRLLVERIGKQDIAG